MGQEQPLFSIIVPTYARPEQLALCLQSLTRLDYTRDSFEVIVVDDGGEMPLESVVAPLQSQLNLTLFTQPNAGPAMARNTGANQARGKFLAFTDDDCTPTADWLQNLAARFALAPDCMIGGRTLNALPDNPYSTASQMLIDYLYGYYNANPEGAKFFASNNLALSAECFHAIGGFNTTFPLAAAEDRELCDRWLDKGYQMIYSPEVQVYHAHQLTFPTFWWQHFNYGRGAFYFRSVRSQRTLERIKVEPLSFYLNLLTYPFLQTSYPQVLLLVFLIIVSQLANIVGFLWEKVNHTER